MSYTIRTSPREEMRVLKALSSARAWLLRNPRQAKPMKQTRDKANGSRRARRRRRISEIMRRGPFVKVVKRRRSVHYTVSFARQDGEKQSGARMRAPQVATPNRVSQGSPVRLLFSESGAYGGAARDSMRSGWLTMILLCLSAGCANLNEERARDYNEDGVYLFGQGKYPL